MVKKNKETKKDPSSAKASSFAEATKDKSEGKKKVKSSGKGEKFADMSAEAIIVEEPKTEEVAAPVLEEKKATKAPKVRGKKYQAARKALDKTKAYLIKDAVETLKKLPSATKFSQTVELHLNVIEKGLAGEAKLPYFKAKERRIAIFNDELASEIKAGKINFDILLATPADMPKILPLAKVLGPKGLMPNPKNGTIVPDPKSAVANFTSGGLHFKTEKDFPLIHSPVGKLNQPAEELIANIEAFIKAVQPKNIKKAFLKSTMSPSIKITF